MNIVNFEPKSLGEGTRPTINIVTREGIWIGEDTSNLVLSNIQKFVLGAPKFDVL